MLENLLDRTESYSATCMQERPIPLDLMIILTQKNAFLAQ